MGELRRSGLHFAHKPSVSLRICFQSFFPLWRAILIVICHFFTSRKTTKKPLIFFSITDLKVSIKFLFLLHKTPPICIRRQKNPCDFGCLNRLVLRTDFNPDYLIFSRFYLKNRITTKPTSKSLFNDFNARRGIATPDFNSMVNDGNYPVRVHKRKRTIGQHLHIRQRLFLRRNA